MIQFINSYEKFNHDGVLFLRNGETLSTKGKAKLANIINHSVLENENSIKQTISFEVSGRGTQSGNEKRPWMLDQT